MSDINAAFVGNLILRGKFECITGLHIGGSKEKLEIGGVDSPVVRDPRTRFPYVPGSSLKGKMRSLLEFGLGVVPVDKKDAEGRDMTGNVSDDPAIVRLFGYGVDEKEKPEKENEKKEKDRNHPLFRVGPSRLIVRDCHVDEETKNWWKTLDTDLLYTEYKSENGINRITSAANPRFIERVAAGSRFNFEIVYSIFNIPGAKEDDDSTVSDLDNLRMALLMLEHNFLGKSGSRGYGRIKFGFADPVWISAKEYRDGGPKFEQLNAPLGDFSSLSPTGSLQLSVPADFK